MSGINVQIRDAAALERVYPTALRAYLADRGWVHQSTWRNRIMVWSKEQGGQTHEALVPLHELTGVYAVRISELIELLSGIEERSQLDVYYDLLGARADVIRLRPLRGSARTGWSLEESADFLGCARDLMLAAARAAERPGLPVYRGRSTGQVRDYVRSIQPLPGYVEGAELTLHSLVPAGFADQGYIADDVKPPFPRQAMLSLNAGLQAAQSAVPAVQGGALVALPKGRRQRRLSHPNQPAPGRFERGKIARAGGADHDQRPRAANGAQGTRQGKRAKRIVGAGDQCCVGELCHCARRDVPISIQTTLTSARGTAPSRAGARWTIGQAQPF